MEKVNYSEAKATWRTIKTESKSGVTEQQQLTLWFWQDGKRKRKSKLYPADKQLDTDRKKDNARKKFVKELTEQQDKLEREDKARLEEAERVRKLEEEQARAKDLPANKPVSKYVNGYIDALEAAGSVKPSAISDYRTSAKRIAEGIGDVAICDLTPDMIQSWEAGLLRSGKGVNTVLKYHRLLNSVYRHAIESRHLDWNPCQAVKKPKRKAPSPNSLNANQHARLIKTLFAMGPTNVATAAAIAALTGMRLGEVCGLKWKCYEQQSGIIRVENAIAKAGGKTYETTPKTESSRRNVPVDAVLKAFIERRRRAMVANLQEAGVTLTDDEFSELYVIGHEDGRYYDPTMLSRGWKMAAELFELIGTRGRLCTFHDLRHTFATIAIAGGADVVAVSKTLGHASPSVTMNVYADALPEAKRRAVALVGESIAAQGEVEPFAELVMAFD